MAELKTIVHVQVRDHWQQKWEAVMKGSDGKNVRIGGGAQIDFIEELVPCMMRTVHLTWPNGIEFGDVRVIDDSSDMSDRTNGQGIDRPNTDYLNRMLVQAMAAAAAAATTKKKKSRPVAPTTLPVNVTSQSGQVETG